MNNSMQIGLTQTAIKPTPNEIKKLNFCTDYAEFEFHNRNYYIIYSEHSVYDLIGKCEHYKDSTGKTERYNATWEDVNEDYIKEYISKNFEDAKEIK